MRLLKLLLSILTCAISLPTKFWRGDWPFISMEEAEQPGDFVHRSNSYWVTTVRYNANFYAKLFAFLGFLTIGTIITLTLVLIL